MSETIFALSSARGAAGVAVVRLSGEAVREVGSVLSGGRFSFDEAVDRRAVLLPIRDFEKGERLDSALFLPFKAPASFTGEDVLELHCHGSGAVLNRLFQLLGKMLGVRPAAAGEFTRRAFLHGKMDMVQAEGLRDLIHAETEYQRRVALYEYEGGMSSFFEDIREKLIAAQAFFEVGIDFADEEIPHDVFEKASETVAGILTQLTDMARKCTGRERLRDGVRLAILGRPNVGKSTLMNALAGRRVAIVSEIEGTTRDIIETYIDIGGFPVVLSDTAGLRETEDMIEKEGVKMALDLASHVDVVLYLIENQEDIQKFSTLGEGMERVLFVQTKADKGMAPVSEQVIQISAQKGQGLEELQLKIAEYLQQMLVPAEGSFLVRERHLYHLKAACGALEQFLAAVKRGDFFIELLAEELRVAAMEVGKITGNIHIEEVYDKIFSSFCIGK